MDKPRLIIIGAGGVGNVVAKKCARLGVFSDIMLASRTISKCDAIAKAIPEMHIQTEQVDADEVDQVINLIQHFKGDIVVNVALPYQDIPIMDACLATGVHYLDTANYEPKDEAKFEYSWQWAYHDRFKERGIMALLGSGFDPGVTGVFTAYIAKHFLDEIHYLDIVDCNAGDHGQPFATNFNPEINIREITQKGKYYEDGQWIEVDPMSVKQSVEYPEIGERMSYLLYHEELESLVKHYPTIRRARFWMTFSPSYLQHLKVLQNVGMTSIEPIEYEGQKIVPLQFLKAVLPEPSSLSTNYQGQTSIGVWARGVKDGKEKVAYVYNNCHHQDAFKDVGSQAVSYTTGVPATIGAELMATKEWFKPGVYNVEQFNPDPFMEKLGEYGLKWNVSDNFEHSYRF